MTLQLRGRAAADIIAWCASRAELKKAQAEEKTLRLRLVDRFWKDAQPGTHTEDLGNGYQLKCEKKQNFKADRKKAGIAVAKLCELGDVGKLIAERLFGWKPEVRVGEYRKLTEEQLALVADAITIEDATPSLELVEPAG